MKEKREKRLESEFRKLIYEILTTKIKNYDITEMFSVTSVTVTSDLEEADVYVSVFSADKAKEQKTFDAIVSSAPEVRKHLAKCMRIRTVPKIKFCKDGSAEYGARIDKIISTFTYANDGPSDRSDET
ncbi:MAG: 30S ribosome-binding factor RbfA [Clostridia bacterium]|nr:30S ribosome-binding factor RbfA [Clostridia bacterium]